MLVRNIYDEMSRYAYRVGQKVSNDEDAGMSCFHMTVDGVTYEVTQKVRSFHGTYRLSFLFPQRMPLDLVELNAVDINKINGKLDIGCFRVVAHNGIVRYCVDTILNDCRVDQAYFQALFDRAVATLKKYAPQVTALNDAF